MESLSQTFGDLVGRAAPDAAAGALWPEIERAYSGAGRHYHTLAHLEAMLGELRPYQAAVADWDALLFALFYHDAVYRVRRADNEEQSAALAARRLAGLGLAPGRITVCEAQIMATKRHEPSSDFATNLLTDADLAILGQPWPRYEDYTRQIRAEYRVYPNLLYRPGRRQVLAHFLAKPRIYHTPGFFDRYEADARANLTRELATL